MGFLPVVAPPSFTVARGGRATLWTLTPADVKLISPVGVVDTVAHAVPFWWSQDGQSFDQLAIRCVAIQAGASIDVGIYNDSAGYPSSLVAGMGVNLPLTAAGHIAAAITAFVPVRNRLYWLCGKARSVGVARYICHDKNYMAPAPWVGKASANTGDLSAPAGYAVTGLAAAAALADPFPAGGDAQFIDYPPAIWLRMVSTLTPY